jgi:hypothetical protein
LQANWESLSTQAWVREYLGVEEDERDRRGLEGRILSARLGAFKSMTDFDWDWTEKDRPRQGRGPAADHLSSTTRSTSCRSARAASARR